MKQGLSIKTHSKTKFKMELTVSFSKEAKTVPITGTATASFV
jgi:hypothetical protein